MCLESQLGDNMREITVTQWFDANIDSPVHDGMYECFAVGIIFTEMKYFCRGRWYSWDGGFVFQFAAGRCNLLKLYWRGVVK